MIPRVCSLPRSGTHFLMAALAANFELGDLAMEATGAPGTVWYADNKNPAVVPWGKLFLSHEPYTEALGDPESILYIHRSLSDVQRSCIRAFLPAPSMEEWGKHIESYAKTGAFLVAYEMLNRGFYQKTMEAIARRFALVAPLAPSRGYIEVHHKVGWVPR